jgi:hypothetical protein
MPPGLPEASPSGYNDAASAAQHPASGPSSSLSLLGLPSRESAGVRVPFGLKFSFQLLNTR